MSKASNQKTDQKSYASTDDQRTLSIYLREIGETPLITSEEEKRLARRIKQGDKKAEEKLIKANLRFVVSVARQYQNQGMALCDLINEGNIGVIKAAKRFDETRGFKFISYAVWWIRQTIKLALAEQSRIVRLPVNRTSTLHNVGKITKKLEQRLGRKPTAEEIAFELGISIKEVEETLKIQNSHLSLDMSSTPGDDNPLMEIIEDEMAPSPDQILLNEGFHRAIATALDTLTAREAEVISLYFGLDNQGKHTLDEIGANELPPVIHWGFRSAVLRQLRQLGLGEGHLVVGLVLNVALYCDFICTYGGDEVAATPEWT